MADAVTYEKSGTTAVLTIDDGKANALSFDVIAALDEGLDRARSEASAVVIAGRPGMFSGGFDLAVMRGGDMGQVVKLVTLGGQLVLRLYSSPQPIVAACTGHAVAAGAFVLMGSHCRVGADGDFRLVLIETQIGMVLPDWAVELTNARLVGPFAQQAAVESRVFDPATAVTAGFLDRVVAPDAVLAAAMEEAERLGALPAGAYAGNAAKVRAPGIERIRRAVEADAATVSGLG